MGVGCPHAGREEKVPEKKQLEGTQGGVDPFYGLLPFQGYFLQGSALAGKGFMVKRTVALVLAFSLAGLEVFGQAPAAPPERSGNIIERRFLNNYRATQQQVPGVLLTNSGRLEKLIRSGRLYLSVQDAIALALENNLDVAVSRLNFGIAEADLLRARAGGLLRGIPTTVSQGSSSAVSQITGNASGQSGAGAGTAGGSAGGSSSTGGTVITQTGTTIPTFDESVFANITYSQLKIPQSNSFTTGVPFIATNNAVYNFGFQKGFEFGGQFQATLSNSYANSNSLRNDINPFTNSSLQLQFTQPLLQGFGFAVNRRNIRVAQNNLKVTDLVFQQQVIATTQSIVNLYSDLVSYTEDVRVKREALRYAEKLYADNKKQVEIGTLAPIEVVKAEAEVATRQQDLTISETLLQQQQVILKNALSRTGIADSLLSTVAIVPTDKLLMPANEKMPPVSDLYEKALSMRPELAQSRVNVENAKIGLIGSKSALLPSLNFVGSLTNNALAGSLNKLSPTAAPAGQFIGGYGTILDQIFNRDFGSWSVGVQLNVPIRNRSARADYIRDQYTLRQQEYNQQSQINQIRVGVSNAVIQLEQAQARYAAAIKSRELQQQSLDAEQKKYALGASTIFFVIQAQRDLATAEGNEVSALSAYNRSKVALDVATGSLLQTYGVSLDEAKGGEVKRTSTPAFRQEP